MIADGLTPAQYAVRYQARQIIAELCAPGLSLQCSLDMLHETTGAPLRMARLQLSMAASAAEDRFPATPDDQSADSWCGWCGATTGLEDDSLPLSAYGPADPAALWVHTPVWFCGDTAACVARRKARYPDRDTAQLRQARAAAAQAREQAAPAVLALTALWAACARQYRPA